MGEINDALPVVLGCAYPCPPTGFKAGHAAVYDPRYPAPTLVSMTGGGGNKPYTIVKK